ncbi:hypothetical protein CSW98_15940 [Vibrio sp. HA2012]|uniref:KilA-N domain-containing protein n=1 Tax=Vibrio sp. HA2012 TaxID=1971595 RepID=UPI000C2C0256|nr:KilA-N domain-containing protein [Vibrio sp. HA2012]PJC85317.1 hypothetical protein CSW98_15940 [Vibrio sp. HA2012]
MTNLTIFSKEIRTLDGLYSLNDLHKASGNARKHQPNLFVRLDSTKELINEIERSTDLWIDTEVTKDGIPSLSVKHDERGKNSYFESDLGIPRSKEIECSSDLRNGNESRCSDLSIAIKAIKGGHKHQGTWVCKELVYAYAMWISAKFHLQVIRAFDAMQQNSPIPADMMIMDENAFLSFSQEQAGFLRTILRLSEKLERREKDTYLKIREMKKLLSMTKTLCAELESEVTTFEQQIVSDQNVISHIHLYRSLILKGENSQALRSYLNMPY